LLGEDLSRTLQACASCRRSTGLPVHYVKRGLGQCFQSSKSAHAGRPEGSEGGFTQALVGGGALPPQAMQGDSLSLKFRRGGSLAVLPCRHHHPEIFVTECFQRLVKSLGQLYLIR